MNVFGVLVAGRLLQTDFTQFGETEFVTEVANADSLNHVVVFLTGVQPFPENLGGAVYIRWQQNGVIEPNWHYLGFISNAKPSAIFKLHNQKADLPTIFGNNFLNAITIGSAQIGIIVEPLNIIESRVPTEGAAPVKQSTIVSFTEKMLNNFTNYIYSFSIGMPNPQNPSKNVDFVPLKAVQDWFDTFQRRLQLNPNYWKSLL